MAPVSRLLVFIPSGRPKAPNEDPGVLSFTAQETAAARTSNRKHTDVRTVRS